MLSQDTNQLIRMSEKVKYKSILFCISGYRFETVIRADYFPICLNYKCYICTQIQPLDIYISGKLKYITNRLFLNTVYRASVLRISMLVEYNTYLPVGFSCIFQFIPVVSVYPVNAQQSALRTHSILSQFSFVPIISIHV